MILQRIFVKRHVWFSRPKNVHLTPRSIKEKSPIPKCGRALPVFVSASLIFGALSKAWSQQSVSAPLSYTSQDQAEIFVLMPEWRQPVTTAVFLDVKAQWSSSQRILQTRQALYSETESQWRQFSFQTQYTPTPSTSIWAGVHRSLAPNHLRWIPSAAGDLKADPFTLGVLATPEALVTQFRYAWITWSDVVMERSWIRTDLTPAPIFPALLSQSPSPPESGFDRVAIKAHWQSNEQWSILASVEWTRAFATDKRAMGLGIGLQYDFGRTDGSDNLTHTSSASTSDRSGDPKITAVRDDFHLVRLSQGSRSGVTAGQQYDVYPSATAESPIARIRIQSTHADESIAKIEEYFRSEWIDEGFTAKPVVVSDKEK